MLDRPPPIDYAVPIRVEVARAAPAAAHAELVEEVAGRLRREQGFASVVTLVPEGTIAGDGKTRRSSSRSVPRGALCGDDSCRSPSDG